MSHNFFKGKLKYKIGDATAPEYAGNKFIMHVCNVDLGWGAGFVLGLSKRWKKPEEEYRKWGRSQLNFKFGEIQVVQVQSDIYVLNMLAMSYKDLCPKNNIPVRYEAVEDCLNKIAGEVKKSSSDTQVFCPRIGAGLGKADWLEIEKLIIKCLIDKGISVTVYDLPSIKDNA